jgi:hypothetical protein
MSGAITALRGGRTWWAHFEFTRMNIAPIILRKKIEDVREVRARWPSQSSDEWSESPKTVF